MCEINARIRYLLRTLLFAAQRALTDARKDRTKGWYAGDATRPRAGRGGGAPIYCPAWAKGGSSGRRGPLPGCCIDSWCPHGCEFGLETLCDANDFGPSVYGVLVSSWLITGSGGSARACEELQGGRGGACSAALCCVCSDSGCAR